MRAAILWVVVALLSLGTAGCVLHVFDLDSIDSELDTSAAAGERPVVGLAYKRVVTLDGKPYESDPQWIESVRSRILGRLRGYALFSGVDSSSTPQGVDLLLHVETTVDMDDPPWLYRLLSRYSYCALPGWRRTHLEQEFSVLTPSKALRFFHRQHASFTSVCSWILQPVALFLPPYVRFEERALALTDRLLDHAVFEASAAGAFRPVVGP